MRIGILTYHCVPNFGAQLQAVSTVGYLKRSGYEPVVLNWYPYELEKMYSLRIPNCQVEMHQKFTEDLLPVSSVCRTVGDLVREIDTLQLQGLIIGSDALFKYAPASVRNNVFRRLFHAVRGIHPYWDVLEGNPFFGGFSRFLKKPLPMCAFSVSSQNCAYKKMNSKEVALMKTDMDAFSYITVRDEWTQKMVAYVTGKRDVPITPDPVFSFNQNTYVPVPSKEEILGKFCLSENYVLFSFSCRYIGKDYINRLSECVKEAGLIPVAFPMPEGLVDFGLANRVDLPLSPLDWYALIKYSCGYVGERMHPIVVAMHNATPFYSFDEYGVCKMSCKYFKKGYIVDSSKTYLLLKSVGLTDNLYAYNGGTPLPDVQEVVNRLMAFDTGLCVDAAQKNQQKYEQGMAQVMNVINSWEIPSKAENV